MTENGIYSPPMKVISNTILFVYSLRGALTKIARVYHTQWYNYFDGTTLLQKKGEKASSGIPWPLPNAWAKPYHPAWTQWRPY